MKRGAKRPRLKVLPGGPTPEPEPEIHFPEEVPRTGSAVVLPVRIHSDIRGPFGIYDGDMLATWRDGPVENGDLVFIKGREEDCLGHYYTAPGGRVKIDHGEGYCVFKPSDILHVCRVMHVERRGEVVRRFPREKGGRP